MVVAAIRELFQRYRFAIDADRIGPDLPFTHWKLHLPSTFGRRFCESKFAAFGVGAEVRPGVYAVACSKISIGANVVLRPGTMLFADPRSGGAGIVIESDVLIGSAVHIYAVNHEYRDRSIPVSRQGHMPSEEVILREGCWVGACAVILPGVVVGRNSVVAAGSVVTKNVPDRAVVGGYPARILPTPSVDTKAP